jgi:hypothetical protein
MSFRRRLHGEFAMQWEDILRKFLSLRLGEEYDVVSWRPTKNKTFSTKSVYGYLEKDIFGPNNNLIWKAKLPLKIQIFMWQTFRNAIPTRDNMRRRKWSGCPVCSF